MVRGKARRERVSKKLDERAAAGTSEREFRPVTGTSGCRILRSGRRGWQTASHLHVASDERTVDLERVGLRGLHTGRLRHGLRDGAKSVRPARARRILRVRLRVADVEHCAVEAILAAVEAIENLDVAHVGHVAQAASTRKVGGGRASGNGRSGRREA